MQQKFCGDGVMERLVPTWSTAIVNQLISKDSVIVDSNVFMLRFCLSQSAPASYWPGSVCHWLATEQSWHINWPWTGDWQ